MLKWRCRTLAAILCPRIPAGHKEQRLHWLSRPFAPNSDFSIQPTYSVSLLGDVSNRHQTAQPAAFPISRNSNCLSICLSQKPWWLFLWHTASSPYGNSISFIFKIYLKSNYFLPSQLLSDWYRLPLSCTWITESPLYWSLYSLLST